MNIEKIKNFSQDEQKTLEFFELLRNEIIRKDNELNEGIDFIFGRKFANKIDILLNLVDKLQEKNKKYKEFFNSMFLKCEDKETDKLVDEILKLESEENF
nr:MAG TPA: hypothetical protein [Caudoviricetes sp.]